MVICEKMLDKTGDIEFLNSDETSLPMEEVPTAPGTFRHQSGKSIQLKFINLLPQ
jgi:hypothetical protein